MSWGIGYWLRFKFCCLLTVSHLPLSTSFFSSVKREVYIDNMQDLYYLMTMTSQCIFLWLFCNFKTKMNLFIKKMESLNRLSIKRRWAQGNKNYVVHWKLRLLYTSVCTISKNFQKYKSFFRDGQKEKVKRNGDFIMS